jgi:hypothetical protein
MNISFPNFDPTPPTPAVYYVYVLNSDSSTRPVFNTTNYTAALAYYNSFINTPGSSLTFGGKIIVFNNKTIMGASAVAKYNTTYVMEYLKGAAYLAGHLSL